MCIIRHTVGQLILQKNYISTCKYNRFNMLENSYIRAVNKRFCTNAHSINLLTPLLLSIPADRCCMPWNAAGSILRYRVLSGCSCPRRNSLVLDYRGSGIYFPRCWNYRNSYVLIRTWNTQIRNSILKFTHGCILTIILLRRVSQHRRIHNLSNQKSYHKRRKPS